MRVDAWLQHPTPGFVNHPMFASLRRWMGMQTVPDDVPLAFTLKAMDAAGVDKALLTAWWGPEGEIVPNALVADAVRRHPDRFAGVCSVDLSRPMEAVRQLRRWVGEGFVGVRVLPWLWQLPPDDRRYYPLYAACVDLGVPFCLQVGHAGPLLPSEPGRPIPYLDRVAAEWPELVIVGGHIGYPWTEEMLSLARKYENVHLDTSAYKPTRYPPELVAFLRGRGREKVLWGSNHPMLLPSQAQEGLDQLGLDDEALGLFLGGNAARVFGL